MTRGLVALFLVACADHDLALGSAEVLAQGQLVKPTPVMEIDALVSEVNGFDSDAAYANDGVDTRFVDAPCDGEVVKESGSRGVTRSKDGRLRKLVLTWTSSRNDDKIFLTTHEAYHYDRSGALRVVIVDREVNHAFDEPFVKAVEEHNDAIARQIATMPKDTESDRVAVAQKGHTVRSATTITQYRAYFEDRKPIYETRREGLELARANDFPDIPQRLPTLYGNAHPANVTSVPYLLSLSPAPQYTAHALPEQVLGPTEPSIRTELIAYDIHDGELSLRTPPACHL